jgi:hypothetical protein
LKTSKEFGKLLFPGIFSKHVEIWNTTATTTTGRQEIAAGAVHLKNSSLGR